MIDSGHGNLGTHMGSGKQQQRATVRPTRYRQPDPLARRQSERRPVLRKPRQESAGAPINRTSPL
jgi:hypothetical protein